MCLSIQMRGTMRDCSTCITLLTNKSRFCENYIGEIHSQSTEVILNINWQYKVGLSLGSSCAGINIDQYNSWKHVLGVWICVYAFISIF